jgi:hypothetical protein
LAGILPRKVPVEHAEKGYAYDRIRQRQNTDIERKAKCVKLKKKVDKLSARNKVVKGK